MKRSRFTAVKLAALLTLSACGVDPDLSSQRQAAGTPKDFHVFAKLRIKTLAFNQPYPEPPALNSTQKSAFDQFAADTRTFINDVPSGATEWDKAQVNSGAFRVHADFIVTASCSGTSFASFSAHNFTKQGGPENDILFGCLGNGTANPVTYEITSFGTTNKSLKYAVSGKPSACVESHRFTPVRTRSRPDIYQIGVINFACTSGSVPFVQSFTLIPGTNSTLPRSSKFPTHTAWVFEQSTHLMLFKQELSQGLFKELWYMDAKPVLALTGS